MLGLKFFIGFLWAIHKLAHNFNYRKSAKKVSHCVAAFPNGLPKDLIWSHRQPQASPWDVISQALFQQSCVARRQGQSPSSPIPYSASALCGVPRGGPVEAGTTSSWKFGASPANRQSLSHTFPSPAIGGEIDWTHLGWETTKKYKWNWIK